MEELESVAHGHRVVGREVTTGTARSSEKALTGVVGGGRGEARPTTVAEDAENPEEDEIRGGGEAGPVGKG